MWPINHVTKPKQVRHYANNLEIIQNSLCYDIQCKIDVINNNIKYIKYIELQIF